MIRAFDIENSGRIDTFLVATMIGSVVLALVLTLHGRRKGKRIAIELSENEGEAPAFARDLEGIILSYLLRAIALVLVFLFLHALYTVWSG